MQYSPSAERTNPLQASAVTDSASWWMRTSGKKGHRGSGEVGIMGVNLCFCYKFVLQVRFVKLVMSDQVSYVSFVKLVRFGLIKKGTGSGQDNQVTLIRLS